MVFREAPPQDHHRPLIMITIPWPMVVVLDCGISVTGFTSQAWLCSSSELSCFRPKPTSSIILSIRMGGMGPEVEILQGGAGVKEHHPLAAADPTLRGQLNLGGEAGGAFRAGEDAGA